MKEEIVCGKCEWNDNGWCKEGDKAFRVKKQERGCKHFERKKK